MGNAPSFSPSQKILQDKMEASMGRILAQQQERLVLGSSANNTERIKPEAEDLARRARVFKKNRQYEQAVDLYSQAIEIDPFNHHYFHHRAETFLNADIPQLADRDAALGLQLLQANPEEHSDDEILCCLWLTRIRVAIDTLEFPQAQDFVKEALRVVPWYQEMHCYLLHYQARTQSLVDNQQQEIAAHPNRPMPFRPCIVHNDGEDLVFFYATKIVGYTSPNGRLQPELLMVDISDNMKENVANMFDLIQNETILQGIFSTLESPSEFGQSPIMEEKILQMQPNGPLFTITAIAVRAKNDCLALQRHLMSECLEEEAEEDSPRGGVIVLKVDTLSAAAAAAPRLILSQQQADVYIATICANAPHWQDRYKKGIKLFVEDEESDQAAAVAAATATGTASNACSGLSFCANCGKKSASPKKCIPCKKVVYCDKDCQKSHWRQHKKTCRSTTAASGAEEETK